MTKDEILEKSRSEGAGYMDEREDQIDNISGCFAFHFGCILCLLLGVVAGICNGPIIICHALGSIFFGMWSAYSIYMAIRSKLKVYWFYSVFGLLSFGGMIVPFIKDLL